MEALLLLFSFFSTLVTSSFLSFSLFLQSLPLLLSRFLSAPSPAPISEKDEPIRLYEGRVRHSRQRPVSHAFDYPVRYALIDLDRAPQPSHLPAARAREVAGTNGPVLLLTIPESVGYAQNPLSIYYCYDLEQENSTRLRRCIAEVTNTPWGEQVSFSFRPGYDLVAKPLHVSPFMDMLGNWNMHVDAPGEDLSVVISVQHPTLGNYFTASLRAKRICSSSNSLTMAAYFWLMPHKVAMWIYWQAVRLWLKNVRFLDHPKFFNSNYRKEALMRDQELSRSCIFSQNMEHLTSNSDGENGKLNHSNGESNGDNTGRWCVWRDAQWPWS
ncbi:uncharacterized protein [Typha angustifolia]|uniref:uncharacterized protein n=1 Tax=Typha angustifolia TaxID=59011 RepID=UPI003C2E02D6